MSLWSDFLNHQGRLAHKWKHYFPAYEEHFRSFINTDVTIYEIGCGSGGSLQLWKRYFGPHARVVGIDIDPKCSAYEEDQIAVRIGDQSDPNFLMAVLNEIGSPDIVIDDGSHMMAHISTTFAALYPHLTRNGVYVVEDLHCAYWPEFEGGFRKETSFIEISKKLIDQLNAEHTRGALTPNAFSQNTLSMHFYDSMIVFRRGRHTGKGAPMFGRSVDGEQETPARNFGLSND